MVSLASSDHFSGTASVAVALGQFCRSNACHRHINLYDIFWQTDKDDV
jgi:hypothetical protein